MNLIDFTNCEKLHKGYDGVNGAKISVRYHGDVYMLKFPSRAKLNPNLTCTNGAMSEYIGCHIFTLLGIETQETRLGVYETKQGIRPVAACKDFTYQNGKPQPIVLEDFASLKNQMIDSKRHGYGTELSDILETISLQNAMDPELLEQRFWDMFVVDEWIANPDRHNGNWGFLYNVETDELTPAPVFDCGSALYSQADADIMKRCLSDPRERDLRVYGRLTSAITINGKRINWNHFNEEHLSDYPGYRKALRRILPRIEEQAEDIRIMIRSAPGITKLQSDFLLTMLTERKENLLLPAYEKSRDLSETHPR